MTDVSGRTALKIKCGSCEVLVNVPMSLVGPLVDAGQFKCPKCNNLQSINVPENAKEDILRRASAWRSSRTATQQPPSNIQQLYKGGGTGAEAMMSMIQRAQLAGTLPPPNRNNFNNMVSALVEDADEEAEDTDNGATFSSYMPKKLDYGSPHPDPIVESASMAAVETPDVTYTPDIRDLAGKGFLSAPQFESIVYASMRHQMILPDGSRGGFFLADSAGLGKGRTLAGMILENWRHGRKKHLWVSVGTDLTLDAKRDLRDVGAEYIPIHPLNKVPYGQANVMRQSYPEGVMFLTYSALVAMSERKQSRIDQLLEWCGEDFDGLMLFDECHKAKNLMPRAGSTPTRTGQNVLLLQEKLPNARVVYCSATGASSPRNMAYMVRLALWGANNVFSDFKEFLSAVESRGLGTLQIVSMEMKARGMYLSRMLSYEGAEFEMVMVPLPEDLCRMYHRSCSIWSSIRASFLSALDCLAEYGYPAPKAIWRQYWATHQRFFRYMCLAAKVPKLVELSNAALANDQSVVIGLQSTGEARTSEVVAEKGSLLADFVSGPRELLLKLVQDHFPMPEQAKQESEVLDLSTEMELSDDEYAPAPKGVAHAAQHPGTRASSRNTASRINMPAGPLAIATDTLEPSVFDLTINQNRYNTTPLSDSAGQPSTDMSEASFKRTVSQSSVSPAAQTARKCAKTSPAVRAATRNAVFANFSTCRDKGGGDGLDDLSDRAPDISWSDRRQQSDGGATTPNDDSPPPIPSAAHIMLQAWKRGLLDLIREMQLPANPLDTIIDSLGGPEKVAEMTGRKARLVRQGNSVVYENRNASGAPGSTLEMINIIEKQLFLDLHKRVAIISEAASAGISLHAERRQINQQRRIHITLEMPWSAERAVQQFGRTHRANQSSAPQYRLLFTELGGEMRFAAAVAKRLLSMGALTQGDQRALGSGMASSELHYDSPWGRMALSTMYTSLLEERDCPLPEHQIPACQPNGSAASFTTSKTFFSLARGALLEAGIFKPRDMSPVQILRRVMQEKTCLVSEVKMDDALRSDVPRFLNRLLGIEPRMQRHIFDFYQTLVAQAVHNMKQDGVYDAGIVELQATRVDHSCPLEVVCRDTTSGASTIHHTLQVDRGMSFQTALQHCTSARQSELEAEELPNEPAAGFWVTQGTQGAKSILYAQVIPSSSPKMMRIMRPKIGSSCRHMVMSDLKLKMQPVLDMSVAESIWQKLYVASNKLGSARIKHVHLLTGSILPFWKILTAHLSNCRHQKDRRLKVIRAVLTSQDTSQTLVGVVIPDGIYRAVLDAIQHANYDA